MKHVIGEQVRWTSQSWGYFREKHGTVVAIVPPYRDPRAYIPYGYWMKRGEGANREHESYLIAVGKRVYWPIVKKLETESYA